MKFAAGVGIGLLVGVCAGWLLSQSGGRPTTVPGPPTEVSNSPPVPEVHPSGRWFVSRKTSALTDQESIFASIESVPYEGRYGKQTAALTVRCFEAKPGIVWSWREAIFSNNGVAAIRMRLDAGEVAWIRPRAADSRDAAFLDGTEAVTLIKRMLEADRMVAMYVPALDNSREVIFDLAGLSAVIGDIQAACPWD